MKSSRSILKAPPAQRPLWDAERARQAYARGWWAKTTLADALAEAAANTPERILVIDGEGRLSARDLRQQARSLAASLLARAPAGSVVSFMLPNWREAAIVYLGATLAGMIAQPILPSLRDRDLGFILQDSGSRFIFIPETFANHDYAAMLSRVTQAMQSPPLIVAVRGGESEHVAFASLLDAAPADPPALDADAVRMMMYTSGTTGRPKGVLHSHNSLRALIRQIGQHWLIEPGDRLLVPSPISHIGGSIYAFECPLLLGTTAILMERWDCDRAIALAQSERWTHMAGATPFLEHLLAAAERAGSNLPDLKVFICGGASVPPALIHRAQRTFHKAFVSRVYGSTEVPVTTVGSIGPGEIDHAAESDGRLGFAEIKLADHPLAPPGEGEICVRGPQMLVGYLHEEDNEAAFDAEGYYKSGDLGRWRDGDHLVITGRAKDIIIRNGENIAAKEVEDLLIRLPSIAEIAVVGVPDARTGERACAVIVPAPGAEPSLQEIGDYLKEQGLARFKTPEQVLLVERLPRNDAGKVQKNLLRERILGAATDRESSDPHDVR